MNYRKLPEQYTDEALKGIYKKTSYMPEEISENEKIKNFTMALRNSPVYTNDISVTLLKNGDYEIYNKNTSNREYLEIDYRTNNVKIFSDREKSHELSFEDASRYTQNIAQFYMTQALANEHAHAIVGIDELRSEIEKAMDRANEAFDGQSMVRVNGVDISVRVEDGKYYFESFEDINEERFKLISKEGLSKDEALSVDTLRDMQKQLLRHQIIRTAELAKEIELQNQDRQEQVNDLKRKAQTQVVTKNGLSDGKDVLDSERGGISKMADGTINTPYGQFYNSAARSYSPISLTDTARTGFGDFRNDTMPDSKSDFDYDGIPEDVEGIIEDDPYAERTLFN